MGLTIFLYGFELIWQFYCVAMMIWIYWKKGWQFYCMDVRQFYHMDVWQFSYGCNLTIFLSPVCPCPRNLQMISETAFSSQTKLIGLNLHVSEHGIGYSNLTPDPQGDGGAPGVKIQVSPNQKTLLTKVVRHNKGMIKVSSAPPEKLGKPAKPVT